ncbi:hypothetical protein [Paraburkholderia humisilvae]|uniref:Uncharacterized protein n=1 Tax=Paraburkholderia humisilvae TaxID=627669 RepID=A0A6J5DN52_9BURK|nr:hypothetical protein [Paraburkholderia humisilvae]CAB3754632.1 hypothetical protein LMG29542_02405 [Paraburkholderia humisilvae]
MFYSHMFYGGHGLGSMVADAVIRSVIYHVVGNAMRGWGGYGHASSGLMLIGVALIVLVLALVVFRFLASALNAVGRSVRGGSRY